MADRTAIEWSDATWNPVTGCDEVSPGCTKCYAKTFAERWRGVPGHHFENGFDVQLREDKLRLPLSWRKPRKVFVNSMSDLFHKDVPHDFIVRTFAIMALTPQHTYQILTKRHARMRSVLGSDRFTELFEREFLDLTVNQRPELAQATWTYPLPNVWLGVSVENQKWAETRVPALLQTPAAIRFVSAEPLLGPVDLQKLKARNGAFIDSLLGNVSTPGGEIYAGCPSILDWVIVGGESGHGSRAMHPNWARSLRNQCVAADVPFLFKQAGSVLARELGIPGKGADLELLPVDLRIREYPHA